MDLKPESLRGKQKWQSFKIRTFWVDNSNILLLKIKRIFEIYDHVHKFLITSKSFVKCAMVYSPSSGLFSS